MATKKASPAKKAAPKKKAVVLDDKKIYKFVADKDSKHMKKGDTFQMNGSMAQHLIEKGLGNVEA
jgi:hypothetical protein